MIPIAFSEYPREPVVIDNLSDKMMKECKFVPLEIGKDFLRIAMVDPDDFYTIEALKLAYGIRIDTVQGKETDILDAIERLYGAGSQSLETIIEEAGKDIYELSSEGIEDADHLRDLAQRPLLFGW